MPSMPGSVVGCFCVAVAVGLLLGTRTSAATPPACSSQEMVQCVWAGPPSPAESNVISEYAFANLTDARVPLGSILTAIRGSCGMLAGGANRDDVITQISRTTGLTNQWSEQLLHAGMQADCPN